MNQRWIVQIANVVSVVIPDDDRDRSDDDNVVNSNDNDDDDYNDDNHDNAAYQGRYRLVTLIVKKWSCYEAEEPLVSKVSGADNSNNNNSSNSDNNNISYVTDFGLFSRETSKVIFFSSAEDLRPRMNHYLRFFVFVFFRKVSVKGWIAFRFRFMISETSTTYFGEWMLLFNCKQCHWNWSREWQT